MNSDNRKYTDWMQAVRLISSLASVYGARSGKLVPSETDEEFLVFFSRQYLRDHAWVILPLWEGDLRMLRHKDGSIFGLTSVLRDYCQRSSDGGLHFATIEQAQWPYMSDSTALTIAHRKIDTYKTDPASLFETSDVNLPYWGHSFLWPSDERFVLYSNGDNAAFVAGVRDQVESLLGFSLDYGVSRFVDANANHPGWKDLVAAYTDFIDEFK